MRERDMFTSQFIYAKSWELSYLLSGTCGLFVREGHQDVKLPGANGFNHLSSLKGVTSYQRDNTATIDNFHVITPCSLNWMLVLN